MTTLSERTKISLFAVLGSIPVICGFIFWLTIIYFKADTAYGETVLQRTVLVEIQKDIREIKTLMKPRGKAD